MKQKLQIEVQRKETNEQALARTVTSPECLSASVLTICQNIEHSEINEVVTELKRQSAAIHVDDLSRAESMLTAQAHTLDGLFARLTTNALTAKQLNSFESYMKLALRAQNQSRATLQTLIELKAPKQIAFVKQANIGNQVQVNNNSARAGKKQKSQTNYWRYIMANGWTPERRAKQAELIRQWQPWKNSTGPTSVEGKATASGNARKGVLDLSYVR